MRLVRFSGVYAPQGDSQLLLDALRRASIPPGARALDLFTGTGLHALALAWSGAREVHAIDASIAAAWSARCNAYLQRKRVRIHRGDSLTTALEVAPFDVVTANPPYIPSPLHAPTGGEHCWRGGRDGRAYIDQLCAAAPQLLAPRGTLLLVHSALCDTALTLHVLRAAGLKASVAARRKQPFGPVLSRHATWLEKQGLIAAGEREEELVVVRGDMPAA